MGIRFIFSLSALLVFANNSAAVASDISCESADKIWSFKQTFSDGGAPPPPGLHVPHWYLYSVEQTAAALSFTWVEESRVDLSDETTADINFRLKKYAQDVVIKAPSGNGPAPVTMYCNHTYYVGPPIPAPPPPAAPVPPPASPKH